MILLTFCDLLAFFPYDIGILGFQYFNTKILKPEILPVAHRCIFFVCYLVDLSNLVYPNLKINNKGQIWKDIALTLFCGKYFYI